MRPVMRARAGRSTCSSGAGAASGAGPGGCRLLHLASGVDQRDEEVTHGAVGRWREAVASASLVHGGQRPLDHGLLLRGHSNGRPRGAFGLRDERHQREPLLDRGPEGDERRRTRRARRLRQVESAECGKAAVRLPRHQPGVEVPCPLVRRSRQPVGLPVAREGAERAEPARSLRQLGASSVSVTAASAAPESSASRTAAFGERGRSAAPGNRRRATRSRCPPALTTIRAPAALGSLPARASKTAPDVATGTLKRPAAERSGRIVTPLITTSKRPARKSWSSRFQRTGTQRIARPRSLA